MYFQQENSNAIEKVDLYVQTFSIYYRKFQIR